MKYDEQGPYVVYSRDEFKMINKQLVYFTAPYVKNKDLTYLVHYEDKDGNLIRQYQDINKKDEIVRVGEPFLIGNGSLVELNICVFDTRTRGKGHRLEGIRILDLIEYRPQDGNAEGNKPQEELAEEAPVEVPEEPQEAPIAPAEPKKGKKVIPF